MAKEDDFLMCCEKLQECLHRFKEANVNLQNYLDHARVNSSIQDMQTSMENILQELEMRR